MRDSQLAIKKKKKEKKTFPKLITHKNKLEKTMVGKRHIIFLNFFY